MSKIDVGPIVEQFEEMIEQAKAGEIVSTAIVCQRPHRMPTCNIALSSASSMDQVITAMHLSAMELHIDKVLDVKLNTVDGLLERKFADFLERMGLIRQEVVNEENQHG